MKQDLKGKARVNIIQQKGYLMTYRQSVLVVLNFRAHRERFITEISQAASQLLRRSIPDHRNTKSVTNCDKHTSKQNCNLHLMIIRPRTIIGHGHNKGIVVLVVIVKRIKEDAQAIPIII